MTTPDANRPGARLRLRRKPPAGTGPNRGGTGASSPGGSPSPRAPKFTHDAAKAVQTGYNVIAENIEQARVVAESFRRGEYNIRDVPVDAQEMTARMLKAARDFSVAAIDAGEWLLKLAKPAKKDGASTGDGAAAATDASSADMKLTSRFVGALTVHTDRLARPKRPTAANDITVRRFEPQSPKGHKIAVRFRSDVSEESGLVAHVTVSPGHPAGVYSGMVYAKGQPVPLGVLSIEVP